MDITKHLRDLNISPSTTRRAIFQYLYEKKNHPTVNQIYTELIHSIPTLSKTTVYNVLELFIEKDMVHVVDSIDNEKHYDLVLIPHGHFICESCNQIFDVPNVKVSYDKNILDGFDVREKRVTFIGVCPTCKQKMN